MNGGQGYDSGEIEIEVLDVDLDLGTAAGPAPAAAPAAAGLAPGRARLAGRSEGVRDALRALLPALDDLERCYRDAEDHAGLEHGVRVALREMWDVFRAHGLQRIEQDRVPFDPALHEAVDVTPSDRVAPGTVLEVLRVGYALGELLVRPALVRVSAAPAATASDEECTR